MWYKEILYGVQRGLYHHLVGRFYPNPLILILVLLFYILPWLFWCFYLSLLLRSQSFLFRLSTLPPPLIWSSSASLLISVIWCLQFLSLFRNFLCESSCLSLTPASVSPSVQFFSAMVTTSFAFHLLKLCWYLYCLFYPFTLPMYFETTFPCSHFSEILRLSNNKHLLFAMFLVTSLSFNTAKKTILTILLIKINFVFAL